VKHVPSMSKLCESKLPAKAVCATIGSSLTTAMIAKESSAKFLQNVNFMPIRSEIEYYPRTALTKPPKNSYLLLCNLSTIFLVEKATNVDNGIIAKVLTENSAIDPLCRTCIAIPAEASVIEATVLINRKILSDADNT
jgi:hypothetical protein